MIQRALTIAVALGLLIAQGLLHHVGLPAWAIPQGLVACLVFLAFYDCSVGGAVTAFVVGLLLDLTSATLLGPWAAAFIAVYSGLTFLSQRLFVESPLVAMMVTGVSTVLAGSMYLLLAFEYQSLSLEDLATLAGQAISSALVSPVIICLLVRATKRSNPIAFRRGSVISAV
jgi:rod shape-determining protein MreD